MEIRSKSIGVIPSSQSSGQRRGGGSPPSRLGHTPGLSVPQAMPLRGLAVPTAQRAWGRGENPLTWVRGSSPGSSGVRAFPVSLPPPNMRAENRALGHRPTDQLTDQPADRPAAAGSGAHVTGAGTRGRLVPQRPLPHRPTFPRDRPSATPPPSWLLGCPQGPVRRGFWLRKDRPHPPGAFEPA